MFATVLYSIKRGHPERALAFLGKGEVLGVEEGKGSGAFLGGPVGLVFL